MLILGNNDYARNRLAGMLAEHAEYIVERLGDLQGLTIHYSAMEALKQIERECPLDDGERTSPDPEDDRILIWHVLPSGHKKVVWHFSGWHWNPDEFYELGQGKLPNDEKSLYAIRCPRSY